MTDSLMMVGRNINHGGRNEVPSGLHIGHPDLVPRSWAELKSA